MKNFIFSFVFFLFAPNTPLLHAFQFDDNYISKYDDKIPDGYYFDKSITGPGSPWITNTRFGLPDTSIVSIKIIDDNGEVMEADSTRLGGGNYAYDWSLLYKSKDFKSGVYYIILNAELNRVNKKNPAMKFEGKTKFILVR